MDKIEGRCPKCLHVLEIPAELSSFSCLYCGAKLALDELLPPKIEGSSEQTMAQYRALLPAIFTDFPSYQQKLNRKDYDPAYQDALLLLSPALRQLDTACCQAPSRRQALLEEGVDAFLAAAQAAMEAEKHWERRSRQEQILFSMKFYIAIYLTPAARQLALSVSEDFVQLLHTQWHQRYPKCPYKLCTYSNISSGFRKHKFCFITTAVCRAEGKPDDCAELTAFRAFRDGFLSRQADGPALVEQYYEIAPAIVMAMDICEDGAVYDHLRQQYLAPCYADLLAGREASCKERYVQMVQALQHRYLNQ